MKKALFVLFLSFIIHYLSFATPVFAACNPPDDYSSCMDQHPDINLRVRGWVPITGAKNLFTFAHPIDPAAPRLNTLIEGEARPVITSLYQVYQWDWSNNTRNGLYPKPTDLPHNDFATLVGFQTGNRAILVPESGYSLGKGLEVLVLYATDNSVTLKYTCDDNVIIGYTIHLENLQVDPDLVAFYNQLDQAGRRSLPALEAGARIGQGDGEVLLVIRDTGSFMDPRWENDWWQGNQAAVGNLLELVEQNLSACGEVPIDVGLDYDALACADFSLQGESTSEVIVPFPPPTGSDTYKGSVQGNISLEKLSFPDFSLPLLAARGYLAAITPDFYKNPVYSRSLSLPAGTLPLKFKHRLEGQPQDEKDNPSRTVSQTVTDVSYAPYVSANYALAALINYYEKGDALSSLNFTLPKFEPEIPPEGGSCPKSGETASIPIPDPSNLNPFFTATDITFHRSISAEPVRDEFGNILYYKRITQIETEDIEVESRSYLPSGKILEKKSESLNSRLPFWVVEKEGQSSAQEGKFEVSLSGLGSETKQEEVKYSGMKAVYDRGCCLLHAIYPFQFKPKDCPCVSEP